jgi:hypothetical protein
MRFLYRVFTASNPSGLGWVIAHVAREFKRSHQALNFGWLSKDMRL